MSYRKAEFDNVRSCKILTYRSGHLLSAARVSALLAVWLSIVFNSTVNY